MKNRKGFIVATPANNEFIYSLLLFVSAVISLIHNNSKLLTPRMLVGRTYTARIIRAGIAEYLGYWLAGWLWASVGEWTGSCTTNNIKTIINQCWCDKFTPLIRIKSIIRRWLTGRRNVCLHPNGPMMSQWKSAFSIPSHTILEAFYILIYLWKGLQNHGGSVNWLGQMILVIRTEKSQPGEIGAGPG